MATKRMRVFPLGSIEKIRDHLVANQIITFLFSNFYEISCFTWINFDCFRRRLSMISETQDVSDARTGYSN